MTTFGRDGSQQGQGLSKGSVICSPTAGPPRSLCGDRDATLVQIIRWLRPGAVIAIVTPDLGVNWRQVSACCVVAPSASGPA